MTGARKLNLISIPEYLAGEEVSAVKHEYIGGAVYAMVGGRNTHNAISSNALGALWSSLKGQNCRPFNSDTKIRVQLPNETRFYYPDCSVVCKSNSPSDSFQDEPVLVIEVLSKSTRRTDEGEKRDAYLSIPSLFAYILVEQEEAAVVVWRRAEQGFVREEFKGVESIIELGEIKACLRMSDLYEGVEFTPETDAVD